MNLPFSILFSLKIQIQSEGAEIFYSDMTLTPIREIPVGILKGNQ